MDKINMDSYSDEHANDLKRTNTYLSISPELFEKLYLSPKAQTRGELRRTFGNPTPVGVLGFCVALTPVSAELMGWRGASGTSATIGASYSFGATLLMLSGIAEFLLGNTFPSVVFLAYGSHFLTMAITYTPFFAAISSYNADGSQEQSPAFLATFGFYAVCMTTLSFIFLICSLRTNAVYVTVFTSGAIGFGLFSGAAWNIAGGNDTVGKHLIVGTGACFFVASMAGWYLLFAIMMTAVDMPFAVPVGDLSTMIKSMSDVERNNQQRTE
ncbi:GPR1/FUN34/yaaH family domain-containing protein [Trichoderma sp. SZMC 28012]